MLTVQHRVKIAAPASTTIWLDNPLNPLPVKIVVPASTTIELVNLLNPLPVKIAALASTTSKLGNLLNPLPVKRAALESTTIKLVNLEVLRVTIVQLVFLALLLRQVALILQIHVLLGPMPVEHLRVQIVVLASTMIK